MSGKTRKPSRYFDACVYLAYLREEINPYGKDKIEAIGSMWRDSERGGLTIVTSTITLTEVLSHKLSADAKKKFTQAIESGLHVCIDVEPPIAIKARDYREYYHANPVKNPFNGKLRPHLTTPDALHLATAVIYGCEEMLTFDGFGEKQNDNSIGLLWLGNKAGTDDLVISQPTVVQADLPGLATALQVSTPPPKETPIPIAEEIKSKPAAQNSN
jgi:predicted nucleic acid-binding protein